MATKNFKAIINNNDYIANEVYKYGEIQSNTAYTRSKAKIFTKKKSRATKQSEAIEASFTRRSNVCKVCFVTIARNGTCNCE